MDLLLTYKTDFDGFDLAQSGADLATDPEIYTAVVVSLFTDRRAAADDELPDGSADRRGWWGDDFSDYPGDQIGSRLWLLDREKHLPEVAARAQQYAEEALAWMVTDNVAARVEVTAELQGQTRLALGVTIYRPTGTPLNYRFANLWEALYAV